MAGVARTMLMTSSLTTIGAIPPFLIGAQAVLITRDLQFGAAGLGAAVSTFFAVAAVVTIGFGGVFERWSSRAGLLLAGGTVAGGGLGLSLLVTDWVGLVAMMALLGVGNAACQGTSNVTVARVLPQNRRGLGFGLKQSAVPAAIMLGGLAVPTTTAIYGWRSTFVVTGTVGILIVVLAMLSRSSTPPATTSSRRARPDRAPRGPLLLCGFAIACGSAAANYLGAYLASWAHEVGLTVSQAGLLMAAGSASSIAVRIVSGLMADRRFGGNLAIVAAQMATGAFCLVAIGAVATPWAVTMFGLLAFALGWSWPGLFLYAVARVGRDAPGQASSVVQAGAFVGGAVGPVAFGLIVADVGFTWAWWAAALSFAVAGLLTMVARAGFRRDLVRRPPLQAFGYGGGRSEPRLIAGPGSGDPGL